MPNTTVPPKNGSFQNTSNSNNTSNSAASSTTSKIFSRTGSIFVSNRKAKEAKEKAALLAASQEIPTPSSASSTTSRPPSNSTTTAAATSKGSALGNSIAASPEKPASTTTATNTTTTPSEADTSQPARADHTRIPSDASIPATFIPTRTSSKSSKRPHRHSQSATNIDLGNLRRSISLRSVTSPHKHSFHTRGTSNSSEKDNGTTTATTSASNTSSHPPLHTQTSRPLLHIPSFAKRQKSADALSSLSLASADTNSPLEPTRTNTAMSTVSSYRSGQVSTAGRPPAVSISSGSQSNGVHSMQMPPLQAGVSQTPQMVYQHIMDTASKRISTLDYLRKAHEGRVYWFNTLLFTKPDLLKFSYFQPAKLARRATNYLLLGFSLPTILDLNSQTPTEYLKALNALLVEFEQFQQLHPPDGSIPSSLSRARVPQMFKRNTGKSRRQSSATDFSSTLGSTPESAFSLPPSSSDSTLLPQENYQHLLTPSLPFDPDFFETFATLCDVLIDCYTKVTQLIKDPGMCTGNVGELFGKADARVRKVIVAGVVREFEERCREGVRSEVAGVGKVVLGGLM